MRVLQAASCIHSSIMSLYVHRDSGLGSTSRQYAFYSNIQTASLTQTHTVNLMYTHAVTLIQNFFLSFLENSFLSLFSHLNMIVSFHYLTFHENLICDLFPFRESTVGLCIKLAFESLSYVIEQQESHHFLGQRGINTLLGYHVF